MKHLTETRWAHFMLILAVVWSVGTAVTMAAPALFGGFAYAGGDIQTGNPCQAKKNPANPCAANNPCAAGAAANPCNPCAPAANPCNPCAPAANPCNPCAAENPCAPAANPCNPCAVKKKN